MVFCAARVADSLHTMFLRWACASGPKARSRSFGREASETREPYSNRPGHFFLSNYICCFFICVTEFGTPTSHEPNVVETCGLRHFVALSCAKVMNISNFGKWARERAEGRKTDFSWPSLTREPFDLESWTLSHFIAQSIPNSFYIKDMKYFMSARAEGPLCALFT